MPQIPDFPSSDEDSESNDGDTDRNRGSIIGRIIDDGFPSPTPG